MEEYSVFGSWKGCEPLSIISKIGTESVDLSPVFPLGSLIPELPLEAVWPASNVEQGNARHTNPHEVDRHGTVSEKDQKTETASTRGTAVINDTIPGRTTETSEQSKSDPGSSSSRAANSTRTKKNTDSTGLTPEEKKEVQELKEQDAKVRRHEQAHVMAGGRYIRSRAQFQYVTGPDGKQYAVSGEVQIDTSEVPDDPEATIQKAQTVRRAALAPADPSPQDRRVAAEANRMEFEARMEVAQQRAEKLRPTDESDEEKPADLSPFEPNLLDLFV